MNQLFHQIRTRSRALAHGVLLVLVATWLSAVCPQCLAQAAELPEMAAHCQQHASPPVERDTNDHDGCPQVVAPVCEGGECAQMSTIAKIEPVAVLLPNVPDAPLPAFTLDGPFSHAYPASPPSSAPVVLAAVPDPCPLYLRHCVFRN